MKRTLSLHQVPMSKAIKKELAALISKGELKIYHCEWFLRTDSVPIGKVKSIRWNDKKRTNTMEVELDSPDGWMPSYNLCRSWTTNKLHINLN